MWNNGGYKDFNLAMGLYINFSKTTTIKHCYCYNYLGSNYKIAPSYC